MNVHLVHFQTGAALIVSLVLLVLVTLLGVAGIQTVALEEKMAANAYDRNIAFQAAEAALRFTEEQVKQGNIGCYRSNGWLDIDINLPLGGEGLVSVRPQYQIMRNIFFCGNQRCCLIRVRSNPGVGRAEVILESMYRF